VTRVGVVDLSTSHPAIFAPILAGLGMPVTVVLEQDEARARAFVATHPAAVAGSLAELAEMCDVVLLLGADWDERLGQVRALAELGVPVFVDKPMVGTAGELLALAELADGPARLDGGSALRVAPEAVAARRSGRAVVEVACGGHPFYYGVHAVALATAILGPGLTGAHGTASGTAVDGVVHHAGGAEIRVAVSVGATGGFTATGPDLPTIEPAAEAFYPALLEDTLTRLTTPSTARRPGRELVECELALLAMAWSSANGGGVVALDEIPRDFRPWRGRDLSR